MVGLSVRHRSNMPKKSIIRRTILVLLLSVLCAAALSSCKYLEHQKAKRNMERVTSEMALAYVADTYGGKAEVLDVEVGTYTVIFSAEIDSAALVTVSLDGEVFQVYVETRPPQLCADNRSGLALGKALDEYFRDLYGLPQALEHSVRIYSNDKDFFASHPTSLGREYSFLDFDYHGQPLEEVLPLVDGLAFQYEYLDDSVSLDRVVLRDEDWGGPVAERMLWLSIRCFRRYNEQSEVPLGIQLVKEQPVMMAEGMVFSKRGFSYGTLSDIAHALPHLALREQLQMSDGEIIRQIWQIAPMGDFWVSTQEGFTAESCYELRPCEPGWADGIDLLAELAGGVYYTREEVKDENSDMASSTRKALRPFVEARFAAVGDQLHRRDGVRERIEAWREEHKWPVGGEHSDPLYVIVRPSLIYHSDHQMASGQERMYDDDKLHHGAKLFTSYLDKKEYWTHGLSFLTYDAPEDLVLLQVVE